MDKSILLQGGLVLAASLLNGARMVPYLRKLKVGQSIREEGPSSHLEKSGTPTIGGLIFILPVLLAYCLWLPKGQADLQIVMAGVMMFAGIGFWDDYLKVVKRHNLGLRAYQKLGLQFVGSAVLILWLYGTGFADGMLEIHTIGRQVDLGWLKVPFLMLFMLATINSVNLTDGLDGLATSVTGIVSAFFMAYAWTQGNGGLAGLPAFWCSIGNPPSSSWEIRAPWPWGPMWPLWPFCSKSSSCCWSMGSSISWNPFLSFCRLSATRREGGGSFG